MTGFPVVDAAMRQLSAMGWIPNRARMIVASFLTKELLIDWRVGERHFMDWLIDGDPAANNGGWQWSAGTGTDAQPYFRIFNPSAQSEKFDPDGRYIRRWIPELRDLPQKFIHAPWEMTISPKSYPLPIVDRTIARERTLAAFRAVGDKRE
jgi:deoxyribodipyrimidine photo-lyase